MCFLSGDVFNIEVHKTWEFTGEKPLRSTLLPCVLYWPAYYILKLCTACGLVGNKGFLSTTSLVLAPRVIIGILGTFVDVLVYRIMKLHKGFDVNSGMWMYTTSYISLIYYTRTFSNTLEAFLFVFLLYIIQTHVKLQARSEKLNPRSKMTVSTRVKDPCSRSGPSVKSLCIIGGLLVAGVFNRPTFVLFLYFPYLYWLCDGSLPKDLTEFLTTCRSLTVRLHQTILCAVLPAVLFVLWDSVYYGSIVELKKFALANWRSNLYDSLTVTPINFAIYNTKSENLAEHGTHSRFTHFFGNIPLLFGPVCIWIFYDIFTLVLTRGNLGLKRTSSLDTTDTKFWIYTSFIPVILLSLFPHQEPRFLIPLLLPVCVLYSHLIFGTKSLTVFQFLWLMLNILGFIFYGFLHQGGVVKAIDAIKLQTTGNMESQTSHVIFSHTYMPPKHLFTIQSSQQCERHPTQMLIQDQQLASFVNSLKCSNQPTLIDSSKLKIYDLKGRPWNYVEEKVKTIMKFWDSKEETVYVVAPSSLEVHLCLNTTNNHFNYIYVTGLSAHLSMEDPPSGEFWKVMNHRGFPESLCENSGISKRDVHQIFAPLLSLNIYKVMPKAKL